MTDLKEEARAKLKEIFATIASFLLSIVVWICVLVFGFGLEVKNWWVVAFGTPAGLLFCHFIVAMARAGRNVSRTPQRPVIEGKNGGRQEGKEQRAVKESICRYA